MHHRRVSGRRGVPLHSAAPSPRPLASSRLCTLFLISSYNFSRFFSRSSAGEVANQRSMVADSPHGPSAPPMSTFDYQTFFRRPVLRDSKLQKNIFFTLLSPLNLCPI